VALVVVGSNFNIGKSKQNCLMKTIKTTFKDVAGLEQKKKYKKLLNS
jgi:ATP-dependent Zn protease